MGASYFLLFEYGTLARSYGLGALLLIAFLSFRRHWVAWPLLAALANVSLHSALLAGICTLFLVLEGRRSLAGLATAALGAGAAALTMWPAADTVVPSVLPDQAMARIRIGLSTASTAVFPAGFSDAWFVWGGRLPRLLALPVAVLGPVLLAIFCCRGAAHRALVLLLYAVLVGFTILLYPASVRHFGMFFLAMLAVTWIQAEAGIAPSRLFAGWCGVLAAIGLWAAGTALVKPFSATREAADWIRAERLADATWAAYPPWPARAWRPISTARSSAPCGNAWRPSSAGPTRPGPRSPCRPRRCCGA